MTRSDVDCHPTETGPQIVTVPLLEPPALTPAPGRRCARVMRGGGRIERRGHRDHAYLHRRPAWSRRCPKPAVVVVDGVPLCAAHAPGNRSREDRPPVES